MNRNFYPFLLFFFLINLHFSASGQSILSRRSGISKVPERGIVMMVGGGLTAVRSSICGSPSCNDFGPTVGVGALYKLSPLLGVSGQLDYARLGASEKDPRRPLDVSFRSEVISLSLTGVYNLLDSYAGSAGYRSTRKRFIVPYARAGVGFIYYTPTSFPGQERLNDSQTTYDPEKNYPALALAIPFGGGLRFRVNDEYSVATEVMYHITSTDYLDNIGPELLPAASKDHYMLAAVKLMYTPKFQNKIFSKKYSSR
ncbi:porin family protein [Pontibacter sp. E15-1]|uniref:outer membrane beta-barrel protein n=1 Tax=Pontibacter sp. E15-1 TaxID=2919918 RepID=UPI001F503F65|nr:outer membrane beta-barrel protein [Pontibacter sp. E15-1]MCJ8166698.1 porin family protein [Pontibacter sp. E15-1]